MLLVQDRPVRGRGCAVKQRETKAELVRIGRLIRKCREDMGYSQAQFMLKLADRGISISQPGVAHWEAGRSDFSISTLAAIADVLRVDVGYLTGQKVQDFEDEKASQYYTGLPPDLQAVARVTLQALFEKYDRDRSSHGRRVTEDE